MKKPLFEKRKSSSIRNKTAKSLIILALFVVVCFWGAQLIVYNVASEPMDVYMMNSIGRTLVEKHEGYSQKHKNELKGYADRYGLNITFFSADIDDETKTVLRTYVIYAVSPFSDSVAEYSASLNWNNEQLDVYFKQYIFNGETEFNYTLISPPTLNYGATFKDSNGTNIYICVETYRATGNINFMTTFIQLLLASVICVVIAVLLSLMYSKRFSGPIIRLSKSAEQLAKGKYDTEFKGGGYKEIDNLADTLNYAVAEIKKTDEFRREFLANVTHDLRTPITMMRGYAEMIRDISGEKKEKRNAHARVIIDESERLSGLVEEILLMSKLESGTIKMKNSNFDISSLVKIVIERFQIKNIMEGYVFDTYLAPDLMILADYQRIEQVLYNLIANALNYTGDDKRVVISSFRTKEEKVRVEVRDTGKGIPPEELNLIWDRYYRIGQIKRKIIGSGLGLNIVKSILESHSANFGVDSTLGEGTIFWFEF